jgi:hypothetical protein
MMHSHTVLMIARTPSALWQALEADLGRDELDAAAIVFLGDYCDRGPHTSQVLDWLVDLQVHARTRAYTLNHMLSLSPAQAECNAHGTAQQGASTHT